jgi:hypothetical protein
MSEIIHLTASLVSLMAWQATEQPFPKPIENDALGAK